MTLVNFGQRRKNQIVLQEVSKQMKKMSRRKVIQLCGVFVFLVVLCLVANAIWQPFEPRYEGKRLSAWTKDLFFIGGLIIDPRTPAVRQKHEQAVAAIQHMGVRILPLALKLCRAKDSWLKEKLEDWSEDWNVKHENFEIHITTDTDKQNEGGGIIWAFGPMAKPAIPDLIKMLENKDQEIASSAMSALQGVGADTIPPLIELLHNPNPEFRRRAASVLGMMEPKAHTAVPALLQCLEDKNEGVRINAVRSLGFIREDAPIVVPALIRCLEEETNNPIIPSDYFWALQHFGTNAKPAVPILIKIIKSQKINYIPPAWGALGALYKIDPEAAQPFIEKWKAGITNASPVNPPSIQQK
jgi:hypothetical protein